MTIEQKLTRLSLFPLATNVDVDGRLLVGGADIVQLAKEYGTPFYVFDEATIRAKCREFKEEFRRRYEDCLVIYASKAFLNRALALLFKEEGLGLDVVSGGELSIARSVNLPFNKIYFHGNNKTRAELDLALGLKVGQIVVDNIYELEILEQLAGSKGVRQDILFRLNPGVDAHTHSYTTTAVLDSKFGLPITTGQAEAAIAKAMKYPHINLIGFHFHLGSPVIELLPYQLAIELVLRFTVEMKKKYEFEFPEFNVGGGFAVPYTLDAVVPSVADYAEAIVSKFLNLSRELGLKLPRLVIEPGRSIVGQAGVAVYSVGTIKDIPGVRKFVCVDGGLGDNIRPALYGAKYEALIANKAAEAATDTVTIAGKYCESGDILIKDVSLPKVTPGDIIAVPVAGAYCLAMASNYNAVPKPAIFMVKKGKARLIRRSENYQDLMRLDKV